MQNVISPTLTATSRHPISMGAGKQAQVQAAVTAAQTMVQRALVNCGQALTLMAVPGNDAYDLGPNFTNAFRTRFGISVNDMPVLVEPTLLYIGPPLVKISNGLNAPLELVDLSVGTQVANVFKKIAHHGTTGGYVRGGGMVRLYSAAQAPGRIHIDFGKLANTNDVARTIVHEASHKFCGTQDHAYHPNLGTLSNVNAKNNADSYAYFAADFVLNPGLAFNT